MYVVCFMLESVCCVCVGVCLSVNIIYMCVCVCVWVCVHLMSVQEREKWFPHLLLLQLQDFDLRGCSGGFEGVAALLQHGVTLFHIALVSLQQLCYLLVLGLNPSTLLKHLLLQVLVLLHSRCGQ